MLSDFDTGIESLSSDKKAISEALAFIPKDIREKIINDIEEELQKNPMIPQHLCEAKN